MLTCGVRRHEAVDLEVEHIQQPEEHWAIVGLKGKGGHMRTIPMPSWVKQILDDWVTAANVRCGKLFRRVKDRKRTSFVVAGRIQSRPRRFH
jgi:integrase